MPRHLRVAAVALSASLLAAGAAATASADDALEALVAAPFTSQLISGGKGTVLAWTVRERGARNVWVAREPALAPKAVTSHREDDGQELDALVVSPDGQWVAYARGNARRSNPRSDPGGVRREVWVVPAAGEKPQLVGEGTEPAFSPDGKRLAYVRDDQIRIASLGEPKSDVGVSVRGTCARPRWSADGALLAFTVDRRDHRLVAVYDPARRSITWLAPGADTDLAPVWSPEGTAVAFLRIDGQPYVSGDDVPEVALKKRSRFQIVVADARTGAGRVAYRSGAGDGGFAQWFPEVPLLWSERGHLLFYSEQDGWLRLYSVTVTAAAGGEPVPLSPPRCEASDASLTAGGAEVLFSANCQDRERPQLWRAAVAGGGPARRLTAGANIEWRPVATAAGRVVYLASTADRPGTPMVLDLQSQSQSQSQQHAEPRPLAPAPRLPAQVAPRTVSWTAPDGRAISGPLFLPPSATAPAGRRPAVIFVHGGPIRQMLPGWHPMHYYHQTYAMTQFLALRGYVVLAPNFRGGTGHGTDFRLAPRTGAAGASEYGDVLAAARYLQRRPDVDPRRIGLWGGSYGGYLTALGLARDSATFAAGVDYAGVHDWSTFRWLETGASRRAPAARRLAWQSSPVAAVDRWRSPVLFIHGDDDVNVEFQQTTDLVHRLRRLGRAPVEVLTLPDEVHFLLRDQSYLTMFRATHEFLDRHLRP